MTLPSQEEIERVYRAAIGVVDRLPESDDRARAYHWLDISENYAVEARERAEPKE